MVTDTSRLVSDFRDETARKKGKQNCRAVIHAAGAFAFWFTL
jgi:hypothetical protein